MERFEFQAEIVLPNFDDNGKYLMPWGRAIK